MRLLAILLLLTSSLLAQPAASQNTVAGRWTVTVDFSGTPLYYQFKFEQQGQKVTGEFAGDKLEGTLTGNNLHFVAKDEQGGSEECTATLAHSPQGDTLSGSIIFIDSDNKEHPDTRSFTAARVPQRSSAPPKRHDFVPTTFYRQFSPFNKPVLTVAPGDAIHTTTVDAGGSDEKGVTRVLGGNPETGPFYVETAVPGDTLVVHITRLRLNRDYAISDDFGVPRALTTGLAVKMKDAGKNVRWHLDLQHGMASPENPGEHMKNFSLAVRPMLGCVATATGPVQSPPGAGDSGGYGGNMDFNEIVEGATVYLPVSVPGALLYVGDGHALQGDGELNGNALETSMDVEFSVDVISGKRVPAPRVESETHIIAMGLAGSLDDAFRSATDNMAAWLADRYKLTPSEVALVLGTSAEYKVSEVADRNAGMVLKISKDRLKTFTAAQ